MQGNTYKLKKGLDLRLKGETEHSLTCLEVGGTYAVCPDDFCGLAPRLLVKEGEHVDVGTPLFTDKATERVNVPSPVSGVVASVVRGERRKLLEVRIEADKAQTFKQFEKKEPADGEAARAALAEAGLLAFVRQRPYDVVASPADTPKGIFVSAFSKMPLAADRSFVLQGREAELEAGVNYLAHIAPIYIGIAPEQEGEAFAQQLTQSKVAEVNVFDGPNPSGNVGVQINHVSPVNKGEVVWTLDVETVCAIGHFAETGRVELVRRVAVAGSCAAQPKYVETCIGAPLSEILKGQLQGEAAHVRIINGNPLVGQRSSLDSHLAAYATEVCAIPEGDDVHEVLGWIAPRLKDFSTSHSYCSWLFPHKRAYNLDCRIKGGERHIIMSGEYDRVFPMDIYAGYLVKAIITGDIDKQEALGIYEVAPEDFAVAEFVDSSKLELQRIVREGLDILRKENA